MTKGCELTYQQAVFNLVQTRANQLADTTALFQSLGGGWWNRVDDPSKIILSASVVPGSKQ
jgi:hypothetical protein